MRGRRRWGAGAGSGRRASSPPALSCSSPRWQPACLTILCSLLQPNCEHALLCPPCPPAQRLGEVEAALAAALEARARLEGDMRRAFMRGVTALNIEAMGLLRGGGGPPAAGAEGPAGQAEAQAAAQGPAAAADPAGVPGEGQVSAEAEAQQDQHRQQLQALLRKAAVGGTAQTACAGWSIGAGPAAEMPPPLHAQLRAATPAPAAAPVAAHGYGLVHAKPAAELPRPLVSIEAVQRVPPMPPSPAHRPSVERCAAGGTPRPVTVPCSLPTHVPPHIADAWAGRGTASPARPATAPARRQQPPAAGAKGQQPRPKQHQQQAVSKRSLAGQQLVTRGPGAATAPAAGRGGAVDARHTRQ